LGYLVNLPQIERDQSGGGICSEFFSAGGIRFFQRPPGPVESRRFFPARGLFVEITTTLAGRDNQPPILCRQSYDFTE